MIRKIYILHNFNARPYFKAVEYFAEENHIEIVYRETNWLKSIVKVLLRRKCVNCNIKAIVGNILFCIKVPFLKHETIIYGTAPYDFRFLWYSLLKNKNNFIYHTSHHKWGDVKSSVFLYGIFTPLFQAVWHRILRSDKVKIVTVTKESKKTLTKSLNISKTVYQIYHSVDVEKFKAANRKNNKRIKVLFVGRFVYEKGLDILIEVIEKVNSNRFEFTLVGDGDYKEKIAYIFERENVNYLGWINNKEKIANTFKEHDILLNPSIRYKDWEELFGIVNIEAMAAGLVVIASNHIGPREIFQNGVDGFLVEENNSDVIVKKLNELDLKRDVLEELSGNATKKANEFNIKNISKQWERVFLHD